MPRPTDATLLRLNESCASESTVDIVLRSGEHFRFSTNRDLTIGAVTYTSLVRETTELKDTPSSAAEISRVGVKLSNVDYVFGRKVASSLRPLELADVTVRRYMEDLDNSSVYRHLYYFGGKLTGPEANELEMSFDVIPKTTASGTSVATSTLNPKEGFPFPGTPSQSAPGSPGNPGGTVGGGDTTGGGGGSTDGNGLPCFIAGTRIFTPRGWQPIEKVRAGWKVYSYNERTLEIEIDTVVQPFEHTVTGYLNLKFENGGHLKVTPEHRFLTSTGEWKPVFDLSYDETVPDYVWHRGAHGWTKQRVVSVGMSERGSYQVYNFHVRKNENYLAGGFAAHNNRKAEVNPEYPQYFA